MHEDRPSRPVFALTAPQHGSAGPGWVQGLRHALSLAERRYGPFARTLTLPVPVDPASATVRLERGLLTVRMAQAGPPVPLKWLEPGGDTT